MTPSLLTLAFYFSVALAIPYGGKDPSTSNATPRSLSAQEEVSKAKQASHAAVPINKQQITLTSAEEASIAKAQWEGTGASMVRVNMTAETTLFNIPHLSVPSGGNTNTRYGSLISMSWGGCGCAGGSVGTGVMMILQNGQVTYQGFHQWLPDENTQFWSFDEISFNPGDQVLARTTSSGNTTATVMLENRSTGQKVSYTYTNQPTELCEYVAAYAFQQFTNLVSFDYIEFSNIGSTFNTNPEFWYSNLDGYMTFYNNTKVFELLDFVYIMNT